MQKAILLLVACAALCQAQDPLKYVPASVFEGVSKIKDVVEKVVKNEKVSKVVAGIVNGIEKDLDVKEGPKKPAFCNDLDCPLFEVLETTKDYELRSYPESHWVQTALTGIDYKAAQYTMFMKLFRYISGQNKAQKKIAMTCPVIVRIIPGQGPACENNFTMAFFVAPTETNPPMATDPTVELIKLPALQAYAQSFKGFANQEKYIAHAEDLGAALTKAGKKFNQEFFYTAGYDAPFKIFNRHNEVWYLAEQ